MASWSHGSYPCSWQRAWNYLVFQIPSREHLEFLQKNVPSKWHQWNSVSLRRWYSFSLLHCLNVSLFFTKSGRNYHNILLSILSYWLDHLKQVFTNYQVGKPKRILFPRRTGLLLPSVCFQMRWSQLYSRASFGECILLDAYLTWAPTARTAAGLAVYIQ